MKNRSAAFTLVEVAVAAALLALVLVPVLTLSMSNRKKLAVSHHHVLAQLAVRDALGALAARPYGELADRAGGEVPDLEQAPDLPGPLVARIEDAGAGTVPDSAVPRMLAVTVTVTWKTGRVSLTRLVSVPQLGLVRPLAL